MRLGVLRAASIFIWLILAGMAPVQAKIIANWDKSARSWNNSHMSNIKAAMQAAGHTVLPDAPIGDATLKAGVLVIGEPVASPTAAEAAKLKDFVALGGMVLVFGDTGIDLPTYNTLLSNLGSSIQFTTSTVGTSSSLPDGFFTTGPNRISGGSLNVTSGNGTAGGKLVDSNYVRYERVGNGIVVVFGDRIDHNDVISATNTSLLLNVVAAAADPPFVVPTLSGVTLLLLGLALAAVASRDARRRRTS
jgi:hypothetical protein